MKLYYLQLTQIIPLKVSSKTFHEDLVREYVIRKNFLTYINHQNPYKQWKVPL